MGQKYGTFLYKTSNCGIFFTLIVKLLITLFQQNFVYIVFVFTIAAMNEYRIRGTKNEDGSTVLIASVNEESYQKIKTICDGSITYTGDKMKDMLKKIANYYGVTQKDMISKNRHADLVKARAVSLYYLVGQGLSLAEAGKHFNRHHATVIHNINVVKKNHMEEYKEIMNL